MAIGDLPHHKDSLQRDTALEHLLLGDLLDLLNDPQGPETQIWCLSVIDTLLRILPREFRTKESGGYLEEVLEEFPSWDRQVRDLQRQHNSLQTQLVNLRANIASSRRGISLRNRFALFEWIEQVHDHNQRETALWQTAFNLDVGVGD